MCLHVGQTVMAAREGLAERYVVHLKDEFAAWVKISRTRLQWHGPLLLHVKGTTC